jgi:hypothetical protein
VHRTDLAKIGALSVISRTSMMLWVAKTESAARNSLADTSGWVQIGSFLGKPFAGQEVRLPFESKIPNQCNRWIAATG